MKILEMFFIIAVLIACMFGALVAMASAPNPAGAVDSNNHTASIATNQSAQLVQSIIGGAVNTTSNGTTTNVQTYQPGMSGMMGWFIILCALFAIIGVIIYIISVYKKMPRGGYRGG